MFIFGVFTTVSKDVVKIEQRHDFAQCSGPWSLWAFYGCLRKSSDGTLFWLGPSSEYAFFRIQAL